jgi:hypothetical protein
MKLSAAWAQRGDKQDMREDCDHTNRGNSPLSQKRGTAHHPEPVCGHGKYLGH